MTSKTWFPAYIALGSNQNNPSQQLETAIAHVSDLDKVEFVSASGFYQSEPYGPVEQDEFVNAVIAVLTLLTPEELMHALLDIEKTMGRERDVRWGPRVIDLDLLAYSGKTSDTDFLKLPHPEIAKRNFVLLPLNDIAPDLIITEQGRVAHLLEQSNVVGDGVKIHRLDK